MSIYSKLFACIAQALSMAVVLMAFVAVDRNELPTLAVIIVPYAVTAWMVFLLCVLTDQIVKIKVSL